MDFLMGKLSWSHFGDAVLFFRSSKTNKRCLFAANIYKTTNLQYESSEAIESCWRETKSDSRNQPRNEIIEMAH